MRYSISHERGSILVISLVILGLLALTLIAVLNMVSTQRTVVSRAQSWNSAIPMCEAGVEDAMAHLNYSGTTNLGYDGWTLTTTNYFRTNAMSGGYYSVAISTSSPPVITSQGFVFDPLKSNYLTRTVQVNTRQNGQFPKGILAKGQITMSGGAAVDSFNSTNTTYSSSGKYDPSKAEANAGVVSTSSGAGIINVGTAKIYGSVDTAPGGTVSVAGGAVGDTAWDSSNSGIQPLHSAADVNTIIPDVSLPAMPGALTLTSGSFTVSGTNYLYMLIGGNYVIPTANFSLSGGSAMIITAPSTLYATNGFSVSGGSYIYIAPGGSLQLYVGGPKACTLSGGGIVNGSQSAANLGVWALPNVTTVTESGGAAFIGTIYAPEADCTFSGNSDASGAVVGNTFTMSGGMNLHYDEALGGPVGYKYLAASWQEK